MKGVPEAAPSTKSTFDAFVFHDTCPSHSCSDKTCGKHTAALGRRQKTGSAGESGAMRQHPSPCADRSVSQHDCVLSCK